MDFYKTYNCDVSFNESNITYPLDDEIVDVLFDWSLLHFAFMRNNIEVCVILLEYIPITTTTAYGNYSACKPRL